jgi:eukaryotic-like serine/threonine-protein kinase
MQPLVNHAPNAQARLGSTLSGKWRLDKVLGVGGVATVFLATHRNQSRAALKLLHPEQAQNHTVRERFVQEGYVANSIDHPGVVRVIDDDISEDGLPYLVMELLEGETLEHRAYRHGDSLPAGDVLALMDQLLDVLIVAHEKRVVHRDIKPDNLFLTREGQLKVLDFGIARLTQAVPHRDVTAVGTLLGTPSFMPPEQARSRWEEVDAQSDLYSVGATMFTLLSGKLVRDAETLTEQLALAVHDPAPKLGNVDKTIAPSVCALVDKALSYEKRNRFPDARSMQREVRRVRELVPPSLTISVTPAPRVPTPQRASQDQPTLLESGRVAVAETRESKPITIAIERRAATALAIGAVLCSGLLIWLFRKPAVSPTPEVKSSTSASSALSSAPAVVQAAPSPVPVASSAPPLVASAAPAPAPSVAAPAHATAPRIAPAAPRLVAAPTARVVASTVVTAVPIATATAPAPAKSADPFSSRY